MGIFKIRFLDVEGEDDWSDRGWDVDLDEGTVFIVDPSAPEMYTQNAEHIIPGAMLLAMAKFANDMSVEEVNVDGDDK